MVLFDLPLDLGIAELQVVFDLVGVHDADNRDAVLFQNDIFLIEVDSFGQGAEIDSGLSHRNSVERNLVLVSQGKNLDYLGLINVTQYNRRSRAVNHTRPSRRLGGDHLGPGKPAGIASKRSRAAINRALGRKSACDIFATDQVIESAANPLVSEPGHRTHLASDSIKKVNISSLTALLPDLSVTANCLGTNELIRIFAGSLHAQN